MHLLSYRVLNIYQYTLYNCTYLKPKKTMTNFNKYQINTILAFGTILMYLISPSLVVISRSQESTKLQDNFRSYIELNGGSDKLVELSVPQAIIQSGYNIFDETGEIVESERKEVKSADISVTTDIKTVLRYRNTVLEKTYGISCLQDPNSAIVKDFSLKTTKSNSVFYAVNEMPDVGIVKCACEGENPNSHDFVRKDCYIKPEVDAKIVLSSEINFCISSLNFFWYKLGGAKLTSTPTPITFNVDGKDYTSSVIKKTDESSIDNTGNSNILNFDTICGKKIELNFVKADFVNQLLDKNFMGGETIAYKIDSEQYVIPHSEITFKARKDKKYFLYFNGSNTKGDADQSILLNDEGLTRQIIPLEGINIHDNLRPCK